MMQSYRLAAKMPWMQIKTPDLEHAMITHLQAVMLIRVSIFDAYLGN